MIIYKEVYFKIRNTENFITNDMFNSHKSYVTDFVAVLILTDIIKRDVYRFLYYRRLLFPGGCYV